jgi:sterol desaturase/sphingolipid hydroxylase (fatty acid hydroxylase superfamily)
MTFAQTLLSPLQPVVAALLAPSSICSIYSLGLAILIAFAWLAWRRKSRGRPVLLRTMARAVFSRRVLLHRSTFADLAYCVIGLATLGAILGWALVSTSWISDGVAMLLRRGLGPAPQWRASDWLLNALRTLALFLAYELGFFVDHWLKHRILALWELHKAHHSAEVLTPLVNFRVHPLDSLILANNLALFIGVIGGVAQYGLGRKAVSFTLFDQNVLMLLYIYLTAQLQHSEIWIPFTGIWGRVFMSPAHHQLHHSADPAHFNCNLGASLAIWDWLAGSLRMPSIEPPGLAFGASGHRHDPHGVMGLVVDPALNALKALVGASAFRRTAAGSVPLRWGAQACPPPIPRFDARLLRRVRRLLPWHKLARFAGDVSVDHGVSCRLALDRRDLHRDRFRHVVNDLAALIPFMSEVEA